MWFIGIGLVLVVLKLAELGPVAALSWWLLLIPFAVAVAWWAWADASGLTQKRAMRRMDEKKAARREKALEALGRGSGKPPRK